ncbi:unnamed protein product [Caenorhabditis brenneri]
MDAPRFPLMRLPVACSQNVLRILKPIQLFEISLASKKSKALVQTLKVKTTEFIARIDNDTLSIKLRAVFLLSDFSNLLNVFKSVEINYRPYSNQMDERTFINHLKYIFNTEKIEVDVGFSSQQFDFEPCFEGRRDVERINLRTSDQEEIRRISNIIKPSKISMLNVTKPRDILFQNVDCLCANNMIIRLEDLLIMNTKNLETSCQMVRANMLNRFLKLWTRGSNSQLERLQLDFELDGSFMEEEILALSAFRVRYFELDRETREITGGMDIFRFDGTMATILVDNINFLLGINFYFEMFVWHDHCIAKETDLYFFDFKSIYLTAAAMDAPRFPLMRLPLDGSKNVLRILTVIELFGISLASKKTKCLVQSLKIKASKFVVGLNNGFSMSLNFSDANMFFSDFQSITNFLEFSVKYENIEYRCSLNGMDGRTFINHLKFIFNTKKLSIEFAFNSEQFDYEPVFKGSRDIEIINLMVDNQEENRRILNIIKPPMVSMITRSPRDILLQNFDTLIVRFQEFSLDDLLSINSRRFETSYPMTPAKLLNRFLKLWTRGSNLQLESLALCFRIDNSFTGEKLFDGLKETQNVEVRYFKSAEKTCKVSGGTNIFRFDGTMATVILYTYARTICRLELSVWHDHCIGKETDL